MLNSFLKNKIKITLLIIFFFIITLPAYAQFKEDITKDQTMGFQENAGFLDTDQRGLATLVGTVIQAFLSLLGVIFIAYMIYAGYHWMTAQGEEEKVTKAKDSIQRAIIGLIVIIAGYAITYWVIYWIL